VGYYREERWEKGRVDRQRVTGEEDKSGIRQEKRKRQGKRGWGYNRKKDGRRERWREGGWCRRKR